MLRPLLGAHWPKGLLFFMTSFDDFSLQRGTLALLADMDITEPTPVQVEAIPALLAGYDLVGQSATGSGKTLAYGIPLVERLAKARVVQALVLVPTRELAMQVNDVLGKLAKNRRLTTAILVGGRSYGPQISALRYGAQIVVGTPGRIKDHLDRGSLKLDNLRICILDEADQMLDIGFAPAIEEILATTPENRQMALFSATIPDWVEKLQQKFLKDPVIVNIATEVGGLSTIEQIAYQVPQDQKIAALSTLLRATEGESSLVFGKTKFGVEKLGKHLTRLGFTVGTLHGNKSQHAREQVLAAFRRGQVQTLLATNVAARGLDIEGIYQVINYELPESSELFTHRVGRTGRMGRQGKAITLLTPSDVRTWRRMTRSLGQNVALQKLAIGEEATVVEVSPSAMPEPPVMTIQEIVESNPRPVRERNSSSRNYERNDERPLRERKAASPGQKRGKPVHAAYESDDFSRESRTKRHRKEYGMHEAPEYNFDWEPEYHPSSGHSSSRGRDRLIASAPPDHFSSDRRSNGRRAGRGATGRQSSHSKAGDKRNAYAVPMEAPQRRNARRKFATAPVAQPRRASGPKRVVGRGR